MRAGHLFLKSQKNRKGQKPIIFSVLFGFSGFFGIHLLIPKISKITKITKTFNDNAADIVWGRYAQNISKIEKKIIPKRLVFYSENL